MMRWRVWVAALLGCVLLSAAPLAAITIPGAPTSSEETITVSSTALGITADLCGTDNSGGVLIQLVSGDIYVSLHSATATPDSNDFDLAAGDYLYVKPAWKLRMIRQTADSTVKAQCFE